MKLYYAPGACSLAPHIALLEARLPFDLAKVDLKTKTLASGASFLDINGKGYVPVLELDDGSRLTECSVILTYIADQAPGSRLIPPNGSFARYRTQEWLAFISTEVHKSFGPLFNPALPEEIRQGWFDRLSNRLDWMTRQSGTSEYLAGTEFTVADCYLFAILSWSKYVRFDLSRWPELTEYMARIGARPAVQTALKEEGLVKG